MRLRFVLALAPLLLGAQTFAQSGVLRVEIGGSRGASDAMPLADSAVRRLTKNLAAAMERPRQDLERAKRWHDEIPFSLPVSVRLARNGRDLQAPDPGPAGGGLTLEFEASGPRAFPPTYQQLLTDTFAQAESTINAIFGQPSFSGTIHVRNYDADIGDRHAVSGGYYVNNNGSGEREIRYPVYNNPEAASVNFVHCLLLAYLGPDSYAFDGFQEGLVRAAAMRVARTAGALPASLDPQLIAQVLENTYDVGTWYDWFNQRPLGGPRFIAPNLVDVPLPPGGSIGGIYLLRYQMSGSAWQKVIAEYPAFIQLFNQGFYASPGIGNDPVALAVLGQLVIDSIAGPNATIEGLSFAHWMRRQYILESGQTLGKKLLVESIPLPPEVGTSDFGVFLVQATFFETLANGDETLLSGTSFPIFWTDEFNRLFPSAQEDRMDIAGAYGSVAPNIPDLHQGSPYRCTVDIPVQDRIARAYLPAGAVATATNTTENDFYGTIAGVQPQGGTLRVKVTFGANTVDNIPITFDTFGAKIDTAPYLGYQKLRVQVIRTAGQNETIVIDRLVNKGPGPLALDLRADFGEATFAPAGGLPRGLSAIGFPVDPFTSLFGDTLGISENQVLAARWNGSKARYDIYPDGGGPVIGNGFFIRLENAIPNFSVLGRTTPQTPIAISLRPGWNLIANPIPETAPTSRVSIVHSVDFPKTFAEAIGVELGTDFFEFVPGPPDAASGAPETGTMTAATQFEPGKAYFVRVLAAEGVSLVFTPQGGFRPGGTLQPTALENPNTDHWKIKTTLSRNQYHTEAFVGQTRTATMAFDAKEDSGIPPSMGGMQLIIQSNENQYRDMRPTFAWTTYRMKAVGLIPGKTYRVQLDLIDGRIKKYEFRDVDGFFRKSSNGSTTYSFIATSAARILEIRVGAGSW